MKALRFYAPEDVRLEEVDASVCAQYGGGFASSMNVPRQAREVAGVSRCRDKGRYNDASAAEADAWATNAQVLLGVEPGDTIVAFVAGAIGGVHTRITRGVH